MHGVLPKNGGSWILLTPHVMTRFLYILSDVCMVKAHCGRIMYLQYKSGAQGHPHHWRSPQQNLMISVCGQQPADI
eukprot:scaffold297524_cov20-Prasinocladus_malaysianus.AAC.1